MQDAAPHIQLEKVRVVYPGAARAALDDVSFCVQPGESLALIGPNGGGKTTLLKVMLGLLAPARGRVQLFGRPPRETRALAGYVPQHNAFDRDFPINVLDATLMGRLSRRRLLRPFYTREDRRAARESLERTGMLQHARRPLADLSGGQIQRVFLARALAARPRILILDEADAHLDPEAVDGLYALLAELAGDLTVILTTHDPEAVRGRVDRMAIVNGGFAELERGPAASGRPA